MTIEAENNTRAVTISEEVDFMEALLRDYEDLPPGAATLIVDRRDELRASMQTAEGGGPFDDAEEGYPMPDGVEEGDSDEYDDDDNVITTTEDEED